LQKLDSVDLKIFLFQLKERRRRGETKKSENMRISEHNISESLIIRMANFAVSKAVFDICKSGTICNSYKMGI